MTSKGLGNMFEGDFAVNAKSPSCKLHVNGGKSDIAKHYLTGSKDPPLARGILLQHFRETGIDLTNIENLKLLL